MRRGSATPPTPVRSEAPSSSHGQGVAPRQLAPAAPRGANGGGERRGQTPVVAGGRAPNSAHAAGALQRADGGDERGAGAVVQRRERACRGRRRAGPRRRPESRRGSARRRGSWAWGRRPSWPATTARSSPPTRRAAADRASRAPQCSSVRQRSSTRSSTENEPLSACGGRASTARSSLAARQTLDHEDLRVGRHQHGVGARLLRHVAPGGEQLDLTLERGVVGARRLQGRRLVLVAVLLRRRTRAAATRRRPPRRARARAATSRPRCSRGADRPRGRPRRAAASGRGCAA